MMSTNDGFNLLNKNLLETVFQEIGKSLKHLKGKFKVELIIVGGASILLNYNFRETTEDIDCYEEYGLLMNDITSRIRDKYHLADDWINTDFKNTTSFTNKIVQYSQYYKTYNGVLVVRTIKDEYLIAMKLVAGRNHKHDYSDIYGILKANNGIDLNKINKAVIDLYGSLDLVDEEAYKMTQGVINRNLSLSYDEIVDVEKDNRIKLIKAFQNKK